MFAKRDAFVDGYFGGDYDGESGSVFRDRGLKNIIILGLGVKYLRILESPFEEYPVLVNGMNIAL